MDRVLKGKVALVTGASSGFGAGIAGQLAKNGATVYIMTRIIKKQGFGTIINISSICAIKTWPGWSVYGADKTDLEQFTRHLYAELHPYGMKATILRPSWGLLGLKKRPISNHLMQKPKKGLFNPMRLETWLSIFVGFRHIWSFQR